MKVVAAQGLKVPKEENPREYITDGSDKAAGDDKAVEIELTAYYIRRMADGELVEVEEAPANPTVRPAPAAPRKAAP